MFLVSLCLKLLDHSSTETVIHISPLTDVTQKRVFPPVVDAFKNKPLSKIIIKPTNPQKQVAQLDLFFIR